ncbi:sigma-70 family RNA polymerase sigma factor [Paracoccus sp. (in: a-proteobacteria)]|uniref:sigma-70 family RNA polymerase sigma factor n=1 Tax=Paracoccus sp. TaxID=267 RepID=UPI00396C717E
MDAAFGEALIRLLPHLRRYALSLARRPDLADDLVQTTVECAIFHAASHDPAQRLQPWLFRITRNAFIDVTRQRTKGTRVDLVENPDILSADGVAVTEMRLMLQATQAAIVRLPVDQAEVLTLVCIDGLSHAEAAEVLGVPKGTVMSRLSRARVALADALGIKRNLPCQCQNSSLRQGRRNVSIDDITLMALADGELEAGKVRSVEAAIGNDPEAQERLARFRRTRDVLETLAREDAAAHPADAALIARIRAASVQRPVPHGPNLTRAPWAALAAGLVLAVMGLGWWLFADDSGTEELQAALANLPSGQGTLLEDGTDMTMVASFRTGTGSFCREIETSREADAGLSVFCPDDASAFFKERFALALEPVLSASLRRDGGAGRVSGPDRRQCASLVRRRSRRPRPLIRRKRKRDDQPRHTHFLPAAASATKNCSAGE